MNSTTVKLEKVYGAYNILSTLKDKALSPKLSYQIYRAYKALETDADFFRKKQLELYNENIEKDENGQFVVLDRQGDIVLYKPVEGGLERMNNEMSELLNTECEIDIRKISLDALLSADLELSPISFDILDFVIE